MDRWCRDVPLWVAFPNTFSTASCKDVCDGGSWNPRLFRLLNGWELEKWVASWGGCMIKPSHWIQRIPQFGWVQRLTSFSVKSFYFFLASRGVGPYPHCIV